MKQIYHNKLKGLPQNRDSLFLLMPINRFFAAGAVTARAFTRAAARGRAGLTVGAADAFLARPLCLHNIGNRTADDKNYGDNRDNRSRHYTLTFSSFFSEYSSASCLFFLAIRIAITAANIATIVQPRIGIQISPKLPPVKSVPKKYTTNPTV